MKMEQSQSQTQSQKKMLSTPTVNQYNHPLANAVHDSQQAFGLEKYGIALDQVPENQYDWQLMALEESVDMNQYNVREIRRLTNVITALHSLVDSKDAEIKRLFDKTQTLGLQKEVLNEVYENQAIELNEEYKKVWAMEEEIKGLKHELQMRELSTYKPMTNHKGEIGACGIDYQIEKAKGRVAHGLSD